MTALKTSRGVRNMMIREIVDWSTSEISAQASFDDVLPHSRMRLQAPCGGWGRVARAAARCRDPPPPGPDQLRVQLLLGRLVPGSPRTAGTTAGARRRGEGDRAPSGDRRLLGRRRCARCAWLSAWIVLRRWWTGWSKAPPRLTPPGVTCPRQDRMGRAGDADPGDPQRSGRRSRTATAARQGEALLDAASASI